MDAIEINREEALRLIVAGAPDVSDEVIARLVDLLPPVESAELEPATDAGRAA